MGRNNVYEEYNPGSSDYPSFRSAPPGAPTRTRIDEVNDVLKVRIPGSGKIDVSKTNAHRQGLVKSMSLKPIIQARNGTFFRHISRDEQGLMTIFYRPYPPDGPIETLFENELDQKLTSTSVAACLGLTIGDVSRLTRKGTLNRNGAYFRLGDILAKKK